MTGAEIVDAVVVSMAGPIAQSHCFRGSSPEWRANRTPREVAAYHECGHAVARHVLGLPLHRFVTIERTEFPDAGAVVFGYASRKGKLSAAQVAELPASCDRVQIVKYIRWLSDNRQDRLDTFRRLRALAEQLIEAHWGTIRHVVSALLQFGELTEDQIRALLVT